MDIKHVLSQNLPEPPYVAVPAGQGPGSLETSPSEPLSWTPGWSMDHDGGLSEIGFRGQGSCSTTSCRVTRSISNPSYSMRRRSPVASGSSSSATADTPDRELWLSDGWAACQGGHGRHPFTGTMRRELGGVHARRAA